MAFIGMAGVLLCSLDQNHTVPRWNIILYFSGFHSGTGIFTVPQERQMWETHLQLLRHLPYTSPHSSQQRTDFSGERGEKPWPAGLRPKGGAYSDLLLASWKTPWAASLPYSPEGALCGPAWLDWEESVASRKKCGYNFPTAGNELPFVFWIEGLQQISRGRGQLYSEPLPPIPTRQDLRGLQRIPISRRGRQGLSSTEALLFQLCIPITLSHFH